jgi:hypothetical protein
MTSHRSGCCRSIAAQLKVAPNQVLHASVTLDDEIVNYRPFF